MSNISPQGHIMKRLHGLTPLVLVFWLVVAVPLITVYILILCLTVAEFVARRVAEYRSPVVGISIILGIILALLKVFI
jgi:hypothetical protein